MIVFSLATLNGTNGFRLNGINVRDYSGRSVSGAGDVNGDGFADIIIGANGADPNENSFAGQSYVIFGKASGFSAGLDLGALNGSDGFRLDGIEPGDRSGRSVSGAGDINGDGFADLIIGANSADPNENDAAGISYVVFGKASDFTAGLDLNNLDGTNGFQLDGIDADDISGISVSGAGDINGDGFDDLIVGANGADADAKDGAGESYVVFGKASGFTAGLNLGALNGTNGFRIDGADPGDFSGISVSGAGDINGDGFADLIVGAIFADPDEDNAAGESYVLFGKASGFFAGVNLDRLDGADGFRLKGVDAGDNSGYSVSGAGDVNGDGIDDLIVGAFSGAPNGDSRAGQSYVVFGKASSFTADLDLSALNGANGFRIDGIDPDDVSGGSVSGAGDVNGDGFADLIVGAVYADPNGNNAAGESYVVFGKASGFTASVRLSGLDGTDGFRLDGIDAYDRSGSSVSGAGDVNGDGFDDLIIGAFSAKATGHIRAGESYVVFGFDSGAVTHLGSSASETLMGNIGANVIIGAQGDDTLVGAGGADVLRGGEGDDILDVADLGFRLVNGGTGLDTLKLSGVGLNLDFTAAGSQLVNSVERIELTGAGAKATLDRLSVLNLSEASNTVAASGAPSARLILADQGWSLTSDNGATHTFANGAATVTLADVLSRDVSGGALADTLLGGSGDDALAGGGGDDALNGGDGQDTADYSGAASLVSVNLTSGAAQDGDGGADTLISIESVIGSDFNDTLIGNAFDNTLIGGAGVDRLNGRGGNDRMEGGAGNDIYTVTDIGDVVVEGAAEGTKDRINTFVDFTNPDNIEFMVGKFAIRGLVLTGSDGRESIVGANKINSPDTIDGRGGNDRIIGLVGNDIINGGAGNDRIFGNSGLDLINGGAGNDVMTGQLGADTFIVGLTAGRDTITDFNGAEDMIDLSAHGFADFTAVQAATTDITGSAVIGLGGAHKLTLLGVLEATLTSDDFLLA